MDIPIAIPLIFLLTAAGKATIAALNSIAGSIASQPSLIEMETDEEVITMPAVEVPKPNMFRSALEMTAFRPFQGYSTLLRKKSVHHTK